MRQSQAEVSSQQWTGHTAGAHEREGGPHGAYVPGVVELLLQPRLAGKPHLVLSLVSLTAVLAALSQLVVFACEKQQAKCLINFNSFRNIHFLFVSCHIGRLLGKYCQ